MFLLWGVFVYPLLLYNFLSFSSIVYLLLIIFVYLRAVQITVIIKTYTLPKLHIPSYYVLKAFVVLLGISFEQLYVGSHIFLITVLFQYLKLSVYFLQGTSLFDHLFDLGVDVIYIFWPVLHHYHHPVIEASSQLLVFLLCHLLYGD